jgi:SSS family solute:Na+ symporter
LWIGLIACILFTAYAVLTSSKFTIDGEKQILLDLGAWNFSHHKYMLGVYSHLIVFFVGWAASYLFPKPEVDESLTIRGYLHERKNK